MSTAPEKLEGLNIYTLSCGLQAFFLACLVITGWHIGSQSFVQINPAFAPMQYNTALGFLFCSFGLISLSIRRNFVVSLFGCLVFLLGFASFLQYILKVDFGIDNAVVEPIFTTKTTHAGRMSSNTALCFMLSGVSLVLISFRKTFFLGTTYALLVLAFLSLVGYFFEYDSLYGWGNLTRMAIHTASGFIIVGAGLISYGLWDWKKNEFSFWEIMPFSIATIIAMISLLTWYAIEEEAQARNKEYMQSLISDTQSVLRDRYHLYEEALRGGLGFFYASNFVEREEWKKYVSALDVEKNLPGINGLGYIDYVTAQEMDAYLTKVRADNAPAFRNHPNTFYPDKFIIKYIEPVEYNVEALGLDIGFEANRRTAAERARDLGIPALTNKIILVQDDKKQPGFLLLLPVYKTQSTPSTIEVKIFQT